MNRRKTLMMLCVICTLIASACNVSFSTARISDATLAKDVNADKEAVGPTDTFEANAPIIHCVVKLANAPADTKVRARWSVVNVPGQEPNYKIVETDVDNAGGGKNIIDFTLKPPPQGLPVGQYKVDVFLNPQPEKAEPPAKTLNFTIK